MAVNRDLIGQAETCGREPTVRCSTWIPARARCMGSKKAAPTTGDFASVCYHPLFLFTDHGDCVAAKLRPGNVSSADGLGRAARAGDRIGRQTQGKRVAYPALDRSPSRSHDLTAGAEYFVSTGWHRRKFAVAVRLRVRDGLPRSRRQTGRRWAWETDPAVRPGRLRDLELPRHSRGQSRYQDDVAVSPGSNGLSRRG